MKSISEQLLGALKQPNELDMQIAMNNVIKNYVPTNPATVQALYDIYMENMIKDGKYHEALDFDAWQEKRSQIKRLDVDMLPDFGPTYSSGNGACGGTK